MWWRPGERLPRRMDRWGRHHSIGDRFMLSILAAGASYIAVPAAMKSWCPRPTPASTSPWRWPSPSLQHHPWLPALLPAGHAHLTRTSGETGPADRPVMQKGLRGDYFRSVRIHLISTPRNVSTALMYSFAQRADTAWWTNLLRVLPGAKRCRPSRPGGHAGQHMPADLLGCTAGWTGSTTARCCSQRHGAPPGRGAGEGPRRLEEPLLPPRPEAADRLLRPGDPPPDDARHRQCGHGPAVRAIGEAGGGCMCWTAPTWADPEGTLRAVCDRLGIPFDAAMLSWPAGPRPEDGAWALHWYANVHRAPASAGRPPATGSYPTTAVRSTRKPCRTTKPSSATPSSPDPCSEIRSAQRRHPGARERRPVAPRPGEDLRVRQRGAGRRCRLGRPARVPRKAC